MTTQFSDIVDRLGGAERDGTNGSGYLTLCPVHGDTTPSLRLTLKDDGRVLMTCRSHQCSFTDIVAAIGMTPADFRDVEAGDDIVTSSASGSKAPPTAAQIQELRDFIDESAGLFADSPAADYVQRWGITEAQATHLKLGYTPAGYRPEGFTGEFLGYSWTKVGRVTVPLYGFDGVPRGIQGRALEDADPKWCSASSPPDNQWSRLGVLSHDHGDDYWQLGEGPGDALAAYAAGTSAVFLRGTSMASGAVNTLVAGLRDKVVILAGDADPAGRTFNTKLGTDLGDAGLDVRVLALPDGIGDVAEWLESDPAAFPRAYAVALRGAAPFSPAPPPPPPPTGGTAPTYMRTIEGNARRLLDQTDGDLGFCPAIGRMYYRNGVWEKDDLNLAVHEMSAMTVTMLSEGRDMVAEGEATGNALLIEAGEAAVKWAVRSQNREFDDSIRRAEKLSAFPVERLDSHKHLLNVTNGTLDLRTGQLRLHDRDDYLTHRLDVAFDPDAVAPRWDKFVHEVFPDEPEMVDWLQRVCGYAATGETVEQCLLLCVGKGANGKSVFWSAISHVLKPLTGVVPFSTFEKKASGASTADLASLRGKRLCLVQEGESNTTLAESIIKRATGGDAVPARHLYQAQMSYMPQFLIVMASNSAPLIRGADEGIWRRIRMSYWRRFFKEEERDPWLTRTLADEAAGILNWIVAGAVQWYSDGLGDPPVVRDASKAYRHTSDELAGFIGTVIVEDPEGSILGSDLMGLYLDWCVAENTRSWSRRALYGAVIERIAGAYKEKRMDGIHIVGVRLASGGMTL